MLVTRNMGETETRVAVYSDRVEHLTHYQGPQILPAERPSVTVCFYNCLLGFNLKYVCA